MSEEASPDPQSGDGGADEDTVRLTVVDDLRGRGPVDLRVPRGANLREALLAAGYSPYAPVAERANCGGRGLCATCGVRFEAASDGDDPDPPQADHWHDRLADRFGYPRLSCQLTCDRDLTVRIPEKRVWGGRESDSA
ncbi:2Fe-2S iron-sulfur cluster-binding protein [Halobium salinum]|uniref:2Fe-2S iron-sulfur cluster-binding protein n=1 Tax=Halobium salinum TaxID=1364940 RepID=A0ABD5PCQ5_9EURY|nr:2Fe-2S iron-sulfur cluster-binding protein [Halobium salinum]